MFLMGTAISFQVTEEPGMMLIQSLVHYRQKLFGRVRAAGADHVLEQRIMAGEEVPGEMHRIRKAYLDLLLQGFHIVSPVCRRWV
jgi:hypothetical protein